jgi:hypothetical protein
MSRVSEILVSGRSVAREVVQAVRELLSQREALARARSRTPEQAEKVALLVDAADRRFDALGDLEGDEVASSSATMVRTGALLVLEAWRVAEGRDDAPLDELFRDATAALDLSDRLRDDALPVLLAAAPVDMDRIPPESLARSVRALDGAARALRAHVDGRSPERIARSAYVRTGLAALAVAALLAWLLVLALRPRNIAFGKPVSLSTRYAGSAPPRALVDGQRAAYDGPGSPTADIVHTERDASPSATIDLGAVRALREIRVYNRGDGYFNEGLPYRIELSEDGTSFHEVAQRTEHFGCTPFDRPWVAPVADVRARFVRVRAQGYLALSEVEVYPW